MRDGGRSTTREEEADKLNVRNLSGGRQTKPAESAHRLAPLFDHTPRPVRIYIRRFQLRKKTLTALTLEASVASRVHIFPVECLGSSKKATSWRRTFLKTLCRIFIVIFSPTKPKNVASKKDSIKEKYAHFILPRRTM